MLSAVDSFIEYLNTELAGDPPVNWVRSTIRDESASSFQHKALNVMLLGVVQDGNTEYCLISLDLVGAESRDTYTWSSRITTILEQTQYTPELDYSVDPLAPTATGKCVSWDIEDIDWQLISARPWRKNEPSGIEGAYVHLNATFPISHSRK